MNRIFRVRVLLLMVAILAICGSLHAQSDAVSAAKYALMMKDYDSAISIYGRLYQQSTEEYYHDYLDAMVQAHKYKDAEKLVQSRIDRNIQAPLMYIDLGMMYKLDGKEKKATESYDMAVQKVNGDDVLTQHMVKTFTDAGMTDYAIKVYERALVVLNNPYVYPSQLATLYAKAGFLDKALDQLFSAPPNQFITTDNIKALLLQLLGTDAERLKAAQKNLVGRINAQPENIYLADLLTWIYTQKGDWDGALMQMEAVDERNKENGGRLMNFARGAVSAKQYEVAAKAYDDVIAKGPAMSLYAAARYEKLNTQLTQLKSDTVVNPQLVAGLLAQYDSFLTQYPGYYAQQAASDYATVAAQYGNDVDRGIEILQRAITSADPHMEGIFKLQLGDYYLLAGKIWDASLVYSQVDKAFKNDATGEDARFRNAKLAYYRGDFEWAQKQLSVLKASTSELIANDALFLSVQITENVQDSNYYPLSRFAAADLLLFCNKDKEAETLLDSIATAFPKHPLIDDILMQHAKIAEKHHDYTKAITYLERIYKEYGKDVLGDDALFEMAEIYRNNLHDNENAKRYYEQLILDFPGSTFVQSARQHLNELSGGATP